MTVKRVRTWERGEEGTDHDDDDGVGEEGGVDGDERAASFSPRGTGGGEARTKSGDGGAERDESDAGPDTDRPRESLPQVSEVARAERRK